MPYSKKDMHIVYKIYINDIRGTIQKYILIYCTIYILLPNILWAAFVIMPKKENSVWGFFFGRGTFVIVLCLYLWQHNGNRTEFKQSSEDESQTYKQQFLYTIYYNIWLVCDKNICAAHTTIWKWGFFVVIVIVFSVGRKTHRRHLCTPQ